MFLKILPGSFYAIEEYGIKRRQCIHLRTLAHGYPTYHLSPPADYHSGLANLMYGYQMVYHQI